VTPELLANGAAVVSIIVALFASALLLGSYVVTQRSGVLTQCVWFGALLLLLATALAAGVVGLFLLG
jgi:cation transporter-like permease